MRLLQVFFLFLSMYFYIEILGIFFLLVMSVRHNSVSIKIIHVQVFMSKVPTQHRIFRQLFIPTGHFVDHIRHPRGLQNCSTCFYVRIFVLDIAFAWSSLPAFLHEGCAYLLRWRLSGCFVALIQCHIENTVALTLLDCSLWYVLRLTAWCCLLIAKASDSQESRRNEDWQDSERRPPRSFPPSVWLFTRL